MASPKRIGKELFNEELLGIINATAKIFPITQEDVDSNNNPNNYEYGRVGRAIYIWQDGEWDYLIADDVNISYSELKGIPGTFKPTPHKHTEEDIEGLDKYGKEEIDTKISNLSPINHKHTEEDIEGLDKYNKEEIDTFFSDVREVLENKSDLDHIHEYAPILHFHNELYANKNIEGTVEDIDYRLFQIENGYTEGHSHPNVDILNSITENMLDNWNTVTSMANKEYVDNELSKKAPKSTLDGHIENVNIHITQKDKDKIHEHSNMELLNKFTEKDGTLQYDGSDICVGGVFVIKREEFIAEEEQSHFDLTLGEYTTNSNRLSIYIYGIKQPNNSFVETNSTSFTMSSGLNEGDRVIAEWIEAIDINGLYEGHGSTHAIGGGDTITPNMIGADLTVISENEPTNGANMWYEVIE